MRIPRSLLFLFAIATAGCHGRKPPPSTDGLTAALQRTAEQTLAVPSIANEEVILSASHGQADPLAKEVLQAASEAGGAAIRSLDAQDHISILATIPENNAEAFKAALRHEKVSMAKASSSGLLIKVLIKDKDTAPSPSP